MKRVGIFGGSFDPVHKGHVAVAESFLASGAIDLLWVMLTPYPPHKQEAEQLSYSHRLNMLKLAFKNSRQIQISTLEKELPAPSYTYKTITALQKEHPDTAFFLCLGEDSIAHFNKWYKYRKILDRVSILVAERPGWDHRSVAPEILEQAIFVDHEPVDLASSDIRLKKKGSDLEFSVPIQVLDYIRKHQLYETA
ncbi:MAG: nicotinate (nicotinamide) nucleotide adenylyltransferase [Balneolaceae bacterium]